MPAHEDPKEVTTVEITQNITTPNAHSSVHTASGFGMPNGGQSCFGVLADVRTTWIHVTGLSTVDADLRDRKDLAAKGHVAIAAYVPGYPTWSPPIC
jgi:hypothetical protein